MISQSNATLQHKVSGIALAAWAAIRDIPELRPGANESMEGREPTYGYKSKSLF